MASVPGIDGMSDLEALAHIGELVDEGGDTGDAGCADRALDLADELEARGVPPKLAAVLDYFCANAWEVRYLQRLSDRALVWDWEQPEVQQQVFLLRRAMNGPAFDGLHPMYRCQILTNLGNQLDKLGRFVEAQAMWTRALAIDSPSPNRNAR